MSAVTTPFSFARTAAEVAEGIDLTGRRVTVTGASSGLGQGRPAPWQTRAPRSPWPSGTWRRADHHARGHGYRLELR